MKHQLTIEQTIINFINRYSLLSGAKKILIGLSGGADSVFALHFFNKYKNKFNIEIAALHINHQLRKNESDGDEKFCSELCKSLNIKFHSVKIDVQKFAVQNKKSIEEAARDLRYQELFKLKDKLKSDLIVTAHHSNDNTETVLLNIVQGAGIKGISGIPISRDSIVRPFLCVTKEEILDYLQLENINFVNDSSNEDNRFRRNYLRNEIIPQLKENINPEIHKSILNSGLILRKQKKILDFFIEKTLKDYVGLKNDKVFISLKLIDDYPDSVLNEIFVRLLPEFFNIEPTFTVVEKLTELVGKQVGTKILVSDDVEVIRERDNIVLYISNYSNVYVKLNVGDKINIGSQELIVEQINSLPVKYTSNPDIEFIDGEKIKGELILRNWKLGDRIKPLGMNGTKKISDVLTDLKIESSDRKNTLVLVNNGKIIWLVNHKLNDDFKVTDKTKNIIKLCLK